VSIEKLEKTFMVMALGIKTRPSFIHALKIDLRSKPRTCLNKKPKFNLKTSTWMFS
jgi:hypothetical protein